MFVLCQTTTGLKLFNDVFYSQTAVCKEIFFFSFFSSFSDGLNG